MPLNRPEPMTVEPSIPLAQNVFAIQCTRASTDAIRAELSRKMLGPNNFGHKTGAAKNIAAE
jgi:hypothetical protein